MTCKIRKMRPADVDEVVVVSREIMKDMYNRFTKGYYPREAYEFDLSQHNRDNYLKLLENKENYFFVAEGEGKIVGAARGRIIGRSGYSILSWIGVHPSEQRQGLGEKFLNSHAFRH
jgi:ribosomal protein S18 acetylase RimI-like enzyme